MAKSVRKPAHEAVIVEYGHDTPIAGVIAEKWTQHSPKRPDGDTAKMDARALQVHLIRAVTWDWVPAHMSESGVFAFTNDAVRSTHEHGYTPLQILGLQVAAYLSSQTGNHFRAEHHTDEKIVSMSRRGTATRPAGTAKPNVYDCRPQAKLG